MDGKFQSRNEQDTSRDIRSHRDMDFCVWISTLLFQIFRFTDWSDFDEFWSMDTSIHCLFLWYH